MGSQATAAHAAATCTRTAQPRTWGSHVTTLFAGNNAQECHTTQDARAGFPGDRGTSSSNFGDAVRTYTSVPTASLSWFIKALPEESEQQQDNIGAAPSHASRLEAHPVHDPTQPDGGGTTTFSGGHTGRGGVGGHRSQEGFPARSALTSTVGLGFPERAIAAKQHGTRSTRNPGIVAQEVGCTPACPTVRRIHRHAACGTGKGAPHAQRSHVQGLHLAGRRPRRCTR